MAGNSTRWNNSKKSKRINNNRGWRRKHKPMKKIFKEYPVTLAIIIICIILAIIGFLTGCQPPPDPLREAIFPCECIYKGYSHEIHFQCQEDKPYKFKDEKYYKKCNKGTVLTEPLNK